MTAAEWKQRIINVVCEMEIGNDMPIDLLARDLEDAESAKQLLRDKGYGWSGLSLLEIVKADVPEFDFDF